MHKLANFGDLLKEESVAPGSTTGAVNTTQVGKSSKDKKTVKYNQPNTTPIKGNTDE